MTNTTPKKHSKTKRRVTDAVLCAKLQETQGNISLTASLLGLTRTGLHNRITRSERLRAVVADARAAIVDAAESALYSAVLAERGWAVCFTLKTLGKSRGYVERQEITGAEGGPIDLALIAFQQAAEKIYGDAE